MVSHRFLGIKFHGHENVANKSSKLPSETPKEKLGGNDMNSIQSRTARGNKGRFLLSEKRYCGKGNRIDLETTTNLRPGSDFKTRHFLDSRPLQHADVWHPRVPLGYTP